jgi:hypothetical protein
MGFALPYRALTSGLRPLVLTVCYSFESTMSQTFAPGDDLIFQLESGFGLLRVLAVDDVGDDVVWHLLAYEDFYPDVESAEKALTDAAKMGVRNPHLALTNRAFERTPAAKIGNRPVSDKELAAYRDWQNSTERKVHDRSALLMLGIR